MPLTAQSQRFVTYFSDALSVDEAAARAFLASLLLISTGADSRTVGQYVRERMCRPTLELLGMSKTQTDRLYSTIEQAVTEAARALPGEDPATWESLERSMRATRDHRTLTRERLAALLEQAGVTVTSGPAKSQQTVMARKLRAGGVGTSARANAIRLRRDWYEIEASFREDLPASFVDEVERARAAVQAAAEEAEASARETGGVFYGARMHSRFARAAQGIADGVSLPVRREDILGCAYQLTDECTVWWSDEFDTSADAPWVRGAHLAD